MKKAIALGKRWAAEDTKVVTADGKYVVVNTASGDDRMTYDEAVELAERIAQLQNANLVMNDLRKRREAAEKRREAATKRREARKVTFIARVSQCWGSGKTAKEAQDRVAKEAGKPYRSHMYRDTVRVVGKWSISEVDGSINAKKVDVIERIKAGRRID